MLQATKLQHGHLIKQEIRPQNQELSTGSVRTFLHRPPEVSSLSVLPSPCHDPQYSLNKPSRRATLRLHHYQMTRTIVISAHFHPLPWTRSMAATPILICREHSHDYYRHQRVLSAEIVRMMPWTSTVQPCLVSWSLSPFRSRRG